MEILTVLIGIGLVIWVLKPILNVSPCVSNITVKELEEDFINSEPCSVQEETLKVEIQNPKFDTSKITEYNGNSFNKFEFRPTNFKEFIGQYQGKEQAKTIIKKVAKGMRSHLFLSAMQGTGKTSFIKLLANELNAKLITRVGKQLDTPEELIEVINEINTSNEKNIVFFIDEIDSLDKKMIKLLNPVIEQFEVSGKKIKPFIFAGASINKDVLLQNNPDFLDRIGHQIFFVHYTDKDMEKIILQYKEQLYSDSKLSNEVLKIIANSCKFCPRIGISLLEDFIVEQDINKVLKNRRIVKNGLTEIDIKILTVLNETTKPIGANSLSQRIGMKQTQYLREFEPFLVEYDYIKRVPSRMITDKGRKFLEELR